MRQVSFIAVFVCLALLGVYGVLTLYDDILTVGRMWETPAVRPHEQPLLIMDKDLVPFSGGETILKNTHPALLSPPTGLKIQDLEEIGKKAYGFYCIHCHGKYMDGLGTVGQSFYPPLRDLKSTHVLKKSDGVLFHEIGYGIKKIPRMPALATTVGVRERWGLIYYIRKFAKRFGSS